jgi:hypothetical protein
MIVGLFRRLVPEEGQPFSAHERGRFFRALANVLDVIYGEPSDGIFDADEVAKLYKSVPPALDGANGLAANSAAAEADQRE